MGENVFKAGAMIISSSDEKSSEDTQLLSHILSQKMERPKPTASPRQQQVQTLVYAKEQVVNMEQAAEASQYEPEVEPTQQHNNQSGEETFETTIEPPLVDKGKKPAIELSLSYSDSSDSEVDIPPPSVAWFRSSSRTQTTD